MDRDSKREYLARVSTLAAIVVAHGLIIYALVSYMTTVRSRNLSQSILVTIVDKPSRSPVALNLPALKWDRPAPVLLAKSVPDVEVPVFPEPSPIGQDVESGEIALSAPSGATQSNRVTLNGSGTSSNTVGVEHPIPVLHYVQPVYPPASVAAREQGYVVVRAVLDKKGRAKTVNVVRGSGFRRLDQATVDAIRWWRFAPTSRSDGLEAQTTIEMEFQLSPPNLSKLPVVVMPFDPAMALRIKNAETAMTGTETPAGKTVRSLEELIKKIQSFESSHGIPAGPIPPIRRLASWGNVLSIHYMGNRAQGLDIEFEDGVPRGNETFHWEHYEVRQSGGASEWLIAVNRDGAIKDAQGMICARAQDSESSCPWR